MVVPQKSGLLLLASSALVAARDNNNQGNDKSSQMFQTASDFATVIGRAAGMSRAKDVEVDTMKNTVVCPLAENVADMIDSAMKEIGDDSPQGKTKGMMNKFVGVTKGIKNVAQHQNIKCDGLDKVQDQADKVLSKLKSNRGGNHHNKRDHDDSDSDDGDESDYDDDDFEEDEDENFNTGDALAASTNRITQILTYSSFKTGDNNLPNDYLCDAVDTASKSLKKLQDEVPTTPHKKTKSEVAKSINNGYKFTENADKNNIKCDSQVSSFKDTLGKVSKKMGVANTKASASATVSSLATKLSATSSGATKETSSSTGSSTGSSSSAKSTSSGSASSTDSDSGAAAITNSVPYIGVVVVAMALL